MIRAFKQSDLSSVMQIWVEANIQAHHFIPISYWQNNFNFVKTALPQAEAYVFEDNSSQLLGFIGLSDTHIAGLFVKESSRSKGIGKQLLNHVKKLKPELSLNVYQSNTAAVRFYKREGFLQTEQTIDQNTNQKEFIMMWTADFT